MSRLSNWKGTEDIYIYTGPEGVPKATVLRTAAIKYRQTMVEFIMEIYVAM